MELHYSAEDVNGQFILARCLTIQDARFQPQLDTLQHSAVLDPFAQDREQRVVLQIVEEGADGNTAKVTLCL